MSLKSFFYRIKCRWIITCVIAGLSPAVYAPAVYANELPDDPLESVMWYAMAERYMPGGKIIFDQRVKVMAPGAAEDQFQVPVTVDATGLKNVEEIVALADLNPIPHILTLRPMEAKAFVGFRVKLQQATPIRVGVRTSDGVWHVNGVLVDAAGGGCTAPAVAHGMNNWMKTLGSTRAIARRESIGTARVSLRMRHPMDTGLANGIPVFYMRRLLVKASDGRSLAEVDLYEPISENPTLTLKPLVGNDSEISVFARDTEGHEFEFSLSVPATVGN